MAVVYFEGAAGMHLEFFAGLEHPFADKPHRASASTPDPHLLLCALRIEGMPPTEQFDDRHRRFHQQRSQRLVLEGYPASEFRAPIHLPTVFPFAFPANRPRVASRS